MKKLFYLLILIGYSHLKAQVGISTNPNYISPAGVSLSVDGSITVRDKIYAGGDGITLGNPGKAGQVLVSQGANLPPRWRTLNIPDIEQNAFYLIYNNAFTDYKRAAGQGITLTNITANNNGNGPYYLGAIRNSSQFQYFTTIQGLNQTFDVFSNDNQVYITFEAMAQINATGNGGVDFVCGVFVGKQGEEKTLRGVRKATLRYDAAQYPFTTFTLITLADGLTIGKYDVEVACKRTYNYNSYTGSFSIGINTSTNLGAFEPQTSLKVEVYEMPQVYHDVLGNPIP